jgi:hypothetical protein
MVARRRNLAEKASNSGHNLTAAALLLLPGFPEGSLSCLLASSIAIRYTAPGFSLTLLTTDRYQYTPGQSVALRLGLVSAAVSPNSDPEHSSSDAGTQTGCGNRVRIRMRSAATYYCAGPRSPRDTEIRLPAQHRIAG